MEAICIGHVSYDITLPLSSYPVENTKTRISKTIECGGGPASNAAYLLAKWGIPTSFVGVVGNDYYGQRIKEEFDLIGVNTTYLQAAFQYQTSSSYILANQSNGSRTIVTAKDSTRGDLLEGEVDVTGDFILVDGEELQTAIKILQEKKEAISILDAGSLKESTLTLGKMVTYIACSKDFAESFTKTKIDHYDLAFLASIHKQLEDYFQTQVIITLEAKGSFIKTDTYKIIPSISVKPVDSTGAGDIFHGALAYFIGNHYDLEKAVRLANVAGAISVERIGGRFAMPSLQEVFERSKESDEVI